LNIAYLAPELGALTSTFVYREVEALRQRGASIALFSTTRPDAGRISEEAKSVVAETDYLYDGPKTALIGAVSGYFVRHPLRFMRVLALAVQDALVSRTPSAQDRFKMLWHFLLGCRLANRLMARGCRHVHAHFAHVPTAIAMYGGLLAGIPFSFTAHANDLYERGTALRQKVRRAAFTAVISEYNRRFLEEEDCPTERVHIVHCGLDVTRYQFRPTSPDNTPLFLFSVGRFVEKKGFHVLVEALARLKDGGKQFRCVIAGDGPLYEETRDRAEAAGLLDRLELPGAMPQERVKELLQAADAFVLPCVVAKSGDRDGIPVALMEAMALGVPVVSTYVSGIPELIQDGENGLLVSEGDVEALAQALEHILDEAPLRESLARRARTSIETEFNLDTIAGSLERLFRESIHGAQKTGGLG
jgi:colanic acid/amylovoran biosynthesis glycosyltransferase